MKQTADNPLASFRVAKSSVRYLGANLVRPECVLVEPGRDVLWVSDARGGVTRITDSDQSFIAEIRDGAQRPGSKPNGLCWTDSGELLCANFGTCTIDRIDRDGKSVVVCEEIDGGSLGQVNFVHADPSGRIWFSVSTRTQPFFDAFRPDRADGYIAVMAQGQAHIVADRLHFPNELRFSADGRWLFVAETTAKRISRFAVSADATLGARSTFGPDTLGAGFPDGIAFDSFGNLWIAMVGADRLAALTPEGELLELSNDGDEANVAVMEREFAACALSLETLQAAKGEMAPLTTSIAFGGADARTVYLGSLAGNRIAMFTSPVAGAALPRARL